MQDVCHRDLKLENTLLDDQQAPRLKICDFGYSKVIEAHVDGLRMLLSTITDTPQKLLRMY